MSLTISDIEYIIVITAIIFLFFLGSKKKEFYDSNGGVDLNTSICMKGIACIFILLSHYGQRNFNADLPWGVSRLVWITFANVALTWFMYFSGYGLSLKQNNSTLIKEQWFKRIKKIYLPLLIVCLCTTLLYAILPEKFSKEELDAFMLSTDIYSLHHISGENIWQIILHSIGWRDWYVCCILLFYSFFYLSQSLNKKIHISQTYLLFIFLVLYYVWAYFYFGPPQAHWYRYCWVFFGGHLHARWKMLEKRERQVSLALFAVLATTALTQGSHMYLSYFIAVFLLIMVMLYNRKYTSEGRVLMFLGGISYFYYLGHLRIGYYTLVYIGSMSIILWLLISTIVAYLLNMLYKTQR